MTKHSNPAETLVVVDCQFDFVEGSLACRHSKAAVSEIVDLINSHPTMPVYYSADWHSPENQSFKENGGIWPVHCVQNTSGAELDPGFSRQIKNRKQRPGPTNIFHKGVDDVVEEYSAFEAKNSEGEVLHEILPEDVLVTGIASEYCVRETVLALAKAGFRPSLFVPGLGFVDEADHQKNLRDLEAQGIELLD